MRTGAKRVLHRSTVTTDPLYVGLLREETNKYRMTASSVGAVVFPSKAKRCSMTWSGKHFRSAANPTGECEGEQTKGSGKYGGI